MAEKLTITTEAELTKAAKAIRKAKHDLEGFDWPEDVPDMTLALRSAATLADKLLGRKVQIEDFRVCGAALCTPFFDLIEDWTDENHPNRYIQWEIEPSHLKTQAEVLKELGIRLAYRFMECEKPAKRFVKAESEADLMIAAGKLSKRLPDLKEALAVYLDKAEPFCSEFVQWASEMEEAEAVLKPLQPAKLTLFSEGMDEVEISSAVKWVLDKFQIAQDCLNEENAGDFLDAVERLAKAGEELYPGIAVNPKELEKAALFGRLHSLWHWDELSEDEEVPDWEAMPIVKRLALFRFTVGHAGIRWVLCQIEREEEGAELKFPKAVEEFFAGLVVLSKVLEQ